MSHAFSMLDVEQRSPEWFAARCGKLTGSVAGDMMATVKTKGLEAAARRELRVRLAVERLTGVNAEDTYINRDMQRGIDLEDTARLWYQAATGHVVRQTGFLQHPSLPVGASVDGHIGDFEGIVELKCPRLGTHFQYWRALALPDEYRYQCVHNLWISGAQWCDFVSFDPRFPAQLQLFVIRLQRNEVDLRAYELLARLFLREVEDEVEAMERLMARAA